MQDDDDMYDAIGESGVLHWLPRLVVTITIVGFVGLAWYAYRTGTQSLKEEDLVVVEADKTPIKEKPQDPGGMKFPNQDKTIFETFANNPQTPPKVERVMPAPEEPIAKQLNTSETKTWVNDKLQQKEEAAVAAAKPEQIIGADPKTAPLPPVQKTASSIQPPVDSNIVSYTMDKELAKGKDVPLSEKTVVPTKKETKQIEPIKTNSEKGPKVQLGAYSSGAEAKQAFAKLEKNFPILANKKPIIVKADLGAKGIFYRLRVGGFASANDAKIFCKGFTAKKQACILAQ